MLTVCFDAAGKDSPEHSVIAVCGLATFAKLWKEFEQRWTERLAKDNLPYFHAGEFAHSTGVFKQGWKGNENRRQALCSDLFTIIVESGCRKFGCVIKIDDYKAVLKKHAIKLPGWPLFEAFGIAAVSSVEDFLAYARGEGIKRNVRYIFEKGDPETTVRQVLAAHGYEQPDFEWGKPYTDNKGFAHDPFLGLQAAGWIAYEYYLDAERLLKGVPSDRWGFRQFETLRGDVKLKHNRFSELATENITKDISERVERLRVATQRLEAIKVEADEERNKN